MNLGDIRDSMERIDHFPDSVHTVLENREGEIWLMVVEPWDSFGILVGTEFRPFTDEIKK